MDNLCLAVDRSSPFDMLEFVSPKTALLLCISDSKLTECRAFLRGGGDGPPSKYSSSDEASVAWQDAHGQIEGVLNIYQKFASLLCFAILLCQNNNKALYYSDVTKNIGSAWAGNYIVIINVVIYIINVNI